MADPILIPCEGSGEPGHLLVTGLMLCAVCGSTLAPLPHIDCDGVMQDHQRRDLLAMIAKGSFDAG